MYEFRLPLHIYNKLKELEGASDVKRDLMHNYFLVNGLDTRKPIFNIEFEYHREILKSYGIDTIEDALSRSKSLFELGCEAVKLIDISKLTKEQLDSPNKRRAPLLPIWEYVSKSYDNKEFMQIETPLEKIERISYRYSLEDARKPIKRQIMRLLIHDNNPTLLYFYELLKKAKEDFQLRKDFQAVHNAFNKENRTLADDLKAYSDEGLVSFEKKLSEEMDSINPDDEQYDELVHTFNTVLDELIERGLVEFPF